ncbi:LytR family transcriptional regulator [Pontibacillus halophilus JSM 076056 = DSM 19796]|uniref:LytR family transcriptional regulator n=1 Tax=Pontibacillus halophilus JSM 076056 = DSM 19796 TaxID=1385510 RepID=A0A0A5GCN6_9BACI|nr:LCP family protein [Pontibacillus halophilus]KGX90946.1 LytR family transcriptional regulator [Pontibacillus halophilus JSM 076056 = DSM 19796]
MNESRSNRHRRKRKRKKRILFVFLALFLIVTGVAGYLVMEAYQASRQSYEGLDRSGDKSDLRNEQVNIGEDPISLLLMGVETYSSESGYGRADTQIIVTLDPTTKEITMTTLPRDTRVEIPASKIGEEYGGYSKLNASYTYGEITDYGANKLAVETVEGLLQVPIDKYVTVNFEGFVDVVDAIGGVTVTIKEPFWEKNIFNNNERIYFEEGETKLNGEEALAFVRMRKRDVNSIYSREERQQQFVKAALQEVISAKTLFKANEISSILGSEIATNLKPQEIFAIQQSFSSISSQEIESFELEGSNQYIGNTAYFIPSETGLANLRQQLQSKLDIEP